MIERLPRLKDFQMSFPFPDAWVKNYQARWPRISPSWCPLQEMQQWLQSLGHRTAHVASRHLVLHTHYLERVVLPWNDSAGYAKVLEDGKV